MDFGSSEDGFSRSTSTPCRICSLSSSERTAVHRLSSCNWDFFYCSNCRNWYEIADRNRDIVHLIKNKNIVSALDYTLSSPDIEAFKEGADFIRRILNKLANLIDRIISPHMVEE